MNINKPTYVVLHEMDGKEHTYGFEHKDFATKFLEQRTLKYKRTGMNRHLIISGWEDNDINLTITVYEKPAMFSF